MDQRKNLLKLVAAFAAVYIIWGSTYLGIRFAIETLPPFLMAGVRFLSAGAILFSFSKFKSRTPITLTHWKSAFIIGALLLLGGNGGVVWAEQFVPSGLTAVLVATVPIWVVTISFLKKDAVKPNGKTVAGVLLGFAGLIFLVNPFNLQGGDVNLYGAAAILIATISWAFGTIYTKHAAFPESKLSAVGMQMICGGILLSLTGMLTGEISEVNFNGISIKSVLAVLYLIIFGSIIAFTSYIWLIEAAGPSKASTYAYVNPVVAVFLGWIFAGEIITIKMIIAAVIIILSVAIINSDFSFLKKRIKRG